MKKTEYDKYIDLINGAVTEFELLKLIAYFVLRSSDILEELDTKVNRL